MPIDISHITSLDAFAAVLHREDGDAVMHSPAPDHYSSLKRAWHTITGQDRLKAREKIVRFLGEAVRTQAGIDCDQYNYLVKKVVQQLLFNHDARSDALLTVSAARRVFAALSEDLQACGCCHRVYPQMEFQEGEETKNVIRWLFGDPQIVGHNFTVLTSKLLKAAAVHKDEELLIQAQRELEALGQHLFGELQSGNLCLSRERLTEIFLGQILALYPFFEPETGTELKLPQKIGDRWELVTFRVEQIPLTPLWLGPPILAFGLLPVEGSAEGARPRLLFPGTSQPTASWSPLDTWADFVPGYSVGEFVFNRWACAKIKKWIQERAKKKVEVTGISLGGSLTLLTVANLPELVSVARAFVPPAVRASVVGRYDEKLKSMERREWPQVSIFWQDGDFISLIGAAWSKFWTAYRLIPGKHLDPISAHNKAFSAQPLTAVVRMDTEKDSKRLSRYALNIVYEIACVPIFILLTIGIGIRAVIYLFKEKK